MKQEGTVLERLDTFDKDMVSTLLGEGLLMRGSLKLADEFVMTGTPPYTDTDKYGHVPSPPTAIVASSEPQIALSHATLVGLDGRLGRGTVVRYASRDEVVVAHHIGEANHPELFDQGVIIRERAAQISECVGYVSFLDPRDARPSNNRPLCYEYLTGAHAIAEAKVTLGDLVDFAPQGNIVQADQATLEGQMPPFLQRYQRHEIDPELMRVLSFAQWRERQESQDQG